MWIWKPKFDEFQRFFYIQTPCSKSEFRKYSNFSWWIYHHSKQVLKTLFCESESQNLTNSKAKLILKISAQNQVRVFWRNLMFWFENFYQVHLETFLQTLRKRSKYLGGLINLDICASKKKSWPHDQLESWPHDQIVDILLNFFQIGPYYTFKAQRYSYGDFFF